MSLSSSLWFNKPSIVPKIPKILFLLEFRIYLKAYLMSEMDEDMFSKLVLKTDLSLV
jgi:hypothetical protein